MENQNENQPEANNEEQTTMTPELLLSSLVNHLGTEHLVVMSLDGFEKINNILQEDEEMYQKVIDLKLPIVPLSLKPQEEQSRIITPDGNKTKEGIIIH